MNIINSHVIGTLIVSLTLLVTLITFGFHWHHAGRYANSKKSVNTDAVVQSIIAKKGRYPTIMPRFYIFLHEMLRAIVVVIVVGVPYILYYYFLDWWVFVFFALWSFVSFIGLYGFAIHITDYWRHSGTLVQEIYYILIVIMQLLLIGCYIEIDGFSGKHLLHNPFYTILFVVGVVGFVWIELLIWTNLQIYIWRTRTTIYTVVYKEKMRRWYWT